MQPARLPEHLKGRYLERRTHEQHEEAPMTPEQARREMGWDALEAERKNAVTEARRAK